MAESEQKWSEEEAKLIHHEAFITGLLHQRMAKEEKPRGLRQILLESTGGAALITVLLGGVLGAMISGIIQYGQKEREFQQTWLKARGDQALVAYKEYLDKQQEVVRHVYELVGSSISAADDLINVTKPEFADTSKYQGDQKEKMKKYLADVNDKYNASDQKWRNERETLALLMNYYHYNSGNSDIIDKWKAVSDSVDAYMNCASQWKLDNPISYETNNACKPQKDALQGNSVELGRTLQVNRTYAWQGWESPDVFRSALSTWQLFVFLIGVPLFMFVVISGVITYLVRV